MKLFVVGVSFRTAAVEVREQLATQASAAKCRGCRVRIAGDLLEVVILSTCNRVEIYGVVAQRIPDPALLFRELAQSEVDVSPYVYRKEGEEAAKHLFSVAAGLDSLVIGETEITGQVKLAYQAAQEAGLTGRVTNKLFQTALQTAKEVRTRTGIGRGATSVGSVAVELAEQIFDGSFTDKTVMIIGAGKMGEACVRHLAKKGARSVLVANRSYDRAASLAAAIGGKAISFESRIEALAQADIVVSSTGASQTILSRQEVARMMPLRGGRPLFLIDIAVPRDIDAEVERLDQVYLYNVDHLETLVRQNVRHREEELAKCQAIIREHAGEWMARLARLPERRPEAGAEARTAWAFAGAVACQG